MKGKSIGLLESATIPVNVGRSNKNHTGRIFENRFFSFFSSLCISFTQRLYTWGKQQARASHCKVSGVFSKGLKTFQSQRFDVHYTEFKSRWGVRVLKGKGGNRKESYTLLLVGKFLSRMSLYESGSLLYLFIFTLPTLLRRGPRQYVLVPVLVKYKMHNFVILFSERKGKQGVVCSWLDPH